MSPEQFLVKIAKQPPAPVYLFLGPEGYQRRICKDAILDKVLPGEERLEGLTQVELDETSLAAILDDARSLSLFASNRVIWIAGAEAALPAVCHRPTMTKMVARRSGPVGLFRAT